MWMKEEKKRGERRVEGCYKRDRKKMWRDLDNRIIVKRQREMKRSFFPREDSSMLIACFVFESIILHDYSSV